MFKKMLTHNYVIIFHYNKETLNIFMTYIYCHIYKKWQNPTNHKL
jgi:hypothetical protein